MIGLDRGGIEAGVLSRWPNDGQSDQTRVAKPERFGVNDSASFIFHRNRPTSLRVAFPAKRTLMATSKIHAVYCRRTELYA